jgi:UDP-N-acetylglucosamine pyrophosphorylase
LPKNSSTTPFLYNSTNNGTTNNTPTKSAFSPLKISPFHHFMCPDYCKAVYDDSPIMMDPTHLSGPFSILVAPYLIESVLKTSDILTKVRMNYL